MDPSRTATVDPPRRRRRARLIAFALGILIFWGVPEMAVRVWNPPLPAFRTITFGDVEASPQLFVKDLRRGWALRPNAEVRFLNRRASINSQGFRGGEIANNRDILLCLGDSTTFGWGVGQAESFPEKLQERLESDSGTRGRWQVVNAGVPAYSSCQVRLNAERLIPRLRPRIVVVCTGNNEAWPVERSDGATYLHRGELALGVAEWLGKSRFLSWLAQAIMPDRAKAYRAPPARLAVPRVSLAELAENLAAIDDVARGHGAKLILLAATVNLHHPPIERELLRLADTEDHRADPAAPPSPAARKELARWRDDLGRVSALLDAGDTSAAETEARELAEQFKDDPRYEWLLGVAISRGGRHEEGRARIEAALELQPFPDRCKPSYRSVIEGFARDRSLSFIDPNRCFEAAASPGLPLNFYSDWCHPSAIGHAVIADALWRESGTSIAPGAAAPARSE